MTGRIHHPRRARSTAARWRSLGVGVVAAALLLTGCDGFSDAEVPGDAGANSTGQPAPIETIAPTAATDAAIAADALDVLEDIEIRPRTEWDGPFDRAGSFGEGWQDPDGNGCDARNASLADAMTKVELLSDGCRVDFGVFTDPYSGETVDFHRGPDTSDRVQVDHVVALYAAWRTGAQDLTYEQRVQFANDPLNLQPTLDWVNDDKKSSSADQWLPPNEEYHCTYVSRQVAVKATYGLWVTQTEHDAMVDVLTECLAGGA